MLALRPYQENCLKAIIEAHRQGISRQLISLPTGAGKTVIFAHLIKNLGLRTLVLAHTVELLDQARDKIKMICPSLHIGRLNASSKEFDHKVVVATTQSARIEANLEKLKAQNFGLCIYDEAHRAASDSSRDILEALGFIKGSQRLLCGFTACAFRQDHRGLGENFDQIVYQKKLRELVEDGYLVKPTGIHIETNVDLSQVQIGDGDFRPESLAAIMDTPELRKLIIDSWLEKARDRKTVCFGVNVAHATKLAECFRANGIKSESIDGGTHPKDRTTILNKYRRGEIDVLVNCMILTEGFDCPETDCVLIARPTQSKGLFQQMAGRGLRLWPNKVDCLILAVGSKMHPLCSTAQLLEDSEPDPERERKPTKETNSLLNQLPINLNQKLKAALLSFDPLSDVFSWQRDEGTHFLKASPTTHLEVSPIGNDQYEVTITGDKSQTLATGLNFEYAFAAAEDFARANKSTFKIADRTAAWREAPASIKQIQLIRSKTGCRAGLDKLTRGQASDLIGIIISQN